MKIFFYSLLVLYVISLFTSIAGMETFSTILFLVFLVELGIDWRTNGFSYVRQKLRVGPDVFVMGFLLWVIIGAVVRFDETSLIVETIGYSRWVFLLYAFSYSLKGHLTPRWEKGFQVVLFLFVLVSAYSLWQSLTGIDFLVSDNSRLKPIGSIWRATGFFNLPLTFAYAFGLSGFLVMAYTLVAKTTLERRIWILSALSSLGVMVALIASSVRGAWLGFVVAGPLLLIPLGKKTFMRISLAFLILAGLAVFGSSQFRQRIGSIVDLKNTSNLGRITIWQGHFEIFKDHPVLGAGLGQNNRLIHQYYERLGIVDGQGGHAHNTYLQFLAGTGVVGLFLYLGFCFYFLMLAIRLWQQVPREQLWYRSVALGSFAGQIFIHVGGLTENNFLDGEVNHNMIFIWALLTAIHWQVFNKIPSLRSLVMSRS